MTGFDFCFFWVTLADFSLPMKAASAVHVDGLGALASGDVMSTEPIGRLHSIWEVYFQRIPSQLGVPVPNLLGATEHVANCVGKIIEVWIRSGGLNPRDDFQSPDASTVAEGLNGISPVQFNAFLSYKPPWSSGISHHISYISIYLYIYIYLSNLSLSIYIIISLSIYYLSLSYMIKSSNRFPDSRTAKPLLCDPRISFCDPRSHEFFAAEVESRGRLSGHTSVAFHRRFIGFPSSWWYSNLELGNK